MTDFEKFKEEFVKTPVGKLLQPNGKHIQQALEDKIYYYFAIDDGLKFVKVNFGGRVAKALGTYLGREVIVTYPEKHPEYVICEEAYADLWLTKDDYEFFTDEKVSMDKKKEKLMSLEIEKSFNRMVANLLRMPRQKTGELPVTYHQGKEGQK